MLTIKRPTPTTVLYTTSTRSAATNLASRTQRILLTALRIVLFLTTSILLCSKALSAFTLLSRYHDTINRQPIGHAIAHLASRMPWTHLVPVSSVILWLVLRKGYTEESLLVIRGLGVQTSTSSPTYLTTASTRFIPTNMIQDVFIHEAFKGFEVKFYLGIVVEGEEEVVVVFPVSF